VSEANQVTWLSGMAGGGVGWAKSYVDKMKHIEPTEFLTFSFGLSNPNSIKLYFTNELDQYKAGLSLRMILVTNDERVDKSQ